MTCSVKLDVGQIAGSVDDPDEDEMFLLDTEVCAIVSERMHAQALTYRVPFYPSHTTLGHAVYVAQQFLDEPFCRWLTIGSNVVVDAIEVIAGQIGDDECPALDG
jgi:hypothetical protein